MTEEFAGTNREKYAFLTEQRYRLAGIFGSDSIWVNESHAFHPASLRFPILSLPNDWQPSGQRVDSYRAMYDAGASAPGVVVGSLR